MLTLLLLGVFGRIFDRDRHFVSLRFGHSAMLFVVLLFALAGAGLDVFADEPRVPATARDRRPRGLTWRMTSAMPGAARSSTRLVASGVKSR